MPGAVAFVCLALLAGCGERAPARAGSDAAKTHAAPAPGAPAAQGGAGHGSGGTGEHGGAAPSREPRAPGGSPGSAVGPTGHPAATAQATPPARAVPSNLPSSAPLTVRLATECVTPGGTQRVVVETLPEAYVAYDNLYADQRDGAVHGGVDGRGRSDARGRFEAAWVVSPSAPFGDVRLDIGASAGDRATIRMIFYRVAPTCP